MLPLSVSFLTFGGYRFLRWVVSFFLRLGVRDIYVLGLVFLRLGVVVLTFRGSNSYVWGLGISTFGG